MPTTEALFLEDSGSRPIRCRNRGRVGVHPALHGRLGAHGDGLTGPIKLSQVAVMETAEDGMREAPGRAEFLRRQP